MILTADLFDLTHTLAAPLLARTALPWEALPEIGGFLRALGPALDPAVYDHPAEEIWIAKDAKVAPTASITGPCIICPGAEIHHCAFIRGNALVGAGAVVGNSTELKNVILFDRVQIPHYNYVGDSILGYRAHMGAGSITSNVKSDKTLVVVKNGGEQVKTGLKKFGAMVGDGVEVGCGSILNPGTVVGRNSNIYPLSSVRGVIPANSIYKRQGEVAEKREDAYLKHAENAPVSFSTGNRGVLHETDSVQRRPNLLHGLCRRVQQQKRILHHQYIVRTGAKPFRSSPRRCPQHTGIDALFIGLMKHIPNRILYQRIGHISRNT